MEEASLYISVISLAFLAFLSILLLNELRTGAGNFYLAGVVFIAALASLLRFSVRTANPLLLILPFLVFPSGFLVGPLLYLYARHTLYGSPPGRFEIYAFSAVTLFVFASHTVLSSVFPEMRSMSDVQSQIGFVAVYTRWLIFASCTYNGALIVRALLLLSRYEAEVAQHFAGSVRDQVLWLKSLFGSTLLFFVLYFTSTVAAWIAGFSLPATPAEGIVIVAMAYLVLFYYIKKPQVFALRMEQTSNVRYARQNLADADRLEHMRRLEEYMVREKPYLDQRISLSDISESLSIPVHHLSMVINIEKKQNFFGFINSYRIADAKAILSSAEFAERTLLDAGFMSGFQSKAAFNRVFKEHTGMTPGQYRAFAQKKITSP